MDLMNNLIKRVLPKTKDQGLEQRIHLTMTLENLKTLSFKEKTTNSVLESARIQV